MTQLDIVLIMVIPFKTYINIWTELSKETLQSLQFSTVL